MGVRGSGRGMGRQRMLNIGYGVYGNVDNMNMDGMHGNSDSSNVDDCIITGVDENQNVGMSGEGEGSEEGASEREGGDGDDASASGRNHRKVTVKNKDLTVSFQVEGEKDGEIAVCSQSEVADELVISLADKETDPQAQSGAGGNTAAHTGTGVLTCILVARAKAQQQQHHSKLEHRQGERKKQQKAGIVGLL